MGRKEVPIVYFRAAIRQIELRGIASQEELYRILQ
jgi:hypothetical protein